MRAWRSTLYAIFMIVTVVPFAFASLVLLLFPLRWRYFVISRWPRWNIVAARVICGIDWRVEGEANLPAGPFILLSKHQSAWETMYFCGFIPRILCFVYKRELHYVPFFGWGLASLHMIHINRSQGRNAFESVVAQGEQRMAEGRVIIIFPEGTRIPVGKRGQYKNGGSRLATRLSVPVVPVAHNAGECWPRNSFIKTPGLVTVSFGPPIASAGKSPDALMGEVEDWIETEMRRISPAIYRDAVPHAP